MRAAVPAHLPVEIELRETGVAPAGPPNLHRRPPPHTLATVATATTSRPRPWRRPIGGAEESEPGQVADARE